MKTSSTITTKPGPTGVIQDKKMKASHEHAVVELKVGPDPRGPRACLHCGKSFLVGEAWQKIWDAEQVYAIGLHDQCVTASQRHQRSRGR